MRCLFSHVRFASVYRDIKDVDDFSAELKKLLSVKGAK